MGITHLDEAPGREIEVGHLHTKWSFLGEAAGCVGAGVRRIEVRAGRWSTPAHDHGREEELFYVLGGRGLSWQKGETYEVGEGDCILHRPGRGHHSLYALDGLDVLAFGPRHSDESPRFPRLGYSLVGGRWVESGDGAVDGFPVEFVKEAEVGPPDLPDPSPRPETIVNVRDVEAKEMIRPRIGRTRRKEIPVRAGHVVSRPAGTGVAHTYRAGDDGLTYLAYGTREPGASTRTRASSPSAARSSAWSRSTTGTARTGPLPAETERQLVRALGRRVVAHHFEVELRPQLLREPALHPPVDLDLQRAATR